MANDDEGGLSAGGGNRSLEELRISQTILGLKLDSISNDLRRASDTLRVVIENLRIRENRTPTIRRAYVSPMGARGQRRAQRHVQPALPEFSESGDGGILHQRHVGDDSGTEEDTEHMILGEPRFVAQPRNHYHQEHRKVHETHSCFSSPIQFHVQQNLRIPHSRPHHHDQHSNPISGSPHTHTVDHIPTKPMTSIFCTNSRRPSQFHNNHTRETHKNPNHQSSNIHNIQTDSSQNHCTQSRFALTRENQFEINKTQEESKAKRLMCTSSLEEEELLNRIDQLQQLDDESMAVETQEISVELSTIDVYHYDLVLHIFNSMPRRSSVSYNAMMSGYLRNGDFDLAREVFDKMPERDLVSWNVMISGYLRNKNLSEAWELFESMPKRVVNTFVELRRHRIEPNEFTFSSFIKGCANQAALDQGIQLAAQVIRFNFDRNPFVSSILVNMYGKCGLLDDSIRLFDDIDNPTEFAWNSWISVFAQHSLGKVALETLDRMIHRGVKPNAITFVSLLTGCSHAGLIDEGLTHFYSMEKTYGLVPREEFIKNMPFEPNAFGWCSFLRACRIHGDKERGKIVAEKLMQLEPENSGPLDTIVCDSVHFAKPVNDKIVLSVLIGQIVSTLGFGFENVKTKGVRRRQWQIAWSFPIFRWTIVLVPLWVWDELRRDFSVGVYHSHKPNMGLAPLSFN